MGMKLFYRGHMENCEILQITLILVIRTSANSSQLVCPSSSNSGNKHPRVFHGSFRGWLSEIPGTHQRQATREPGQPLRDQSIVPQGLVMPDPETPRPSTSWGWGINNWKKIYKKDLRSFSPSLCGFYTKNNSDVKGPSYKLQVNLFPSLHSGHCLRVTQSPQQASTSKANLLIQLTPYLVNVLLTFHSGLT